MNLRTILKSVSIEDLRRFLREQPKLEKLQRLEDERHKLKSALAKVEVKISKIDLDHENGSAVKIPKAKGPGKRGRRKGFKVSAATRRKMSEAARKRYAGKSKTELEAKMPRKHKPHKMSAAGRASIAAAQRARWERIRAAAKPEPVKDAMPT